MTDHYWRLLNAVIGKIKCLRGAIFDKNVPLNAIALLLLQIIHLLLLESYLRGRRTDLGNAQRAYKVEVGVEPPVTVLCILQCCLQSFFVYSVEICGLKRVLLPCFWLLWDLLHELLKIHAHDCLGG